MRGQAAVEKADVNAGETHIDFVGAHNVGQLLLGVPHRRLAQLGLCVQRAHLCGVNENLEFASSCTLGQATRRVARFPPTCVPECKRMIHRVSGTALRQAYKHAGTA